MNSALCGRAPWAGGLVCNGPRGLKNVVCYDRWVAARVSLSGTYFASAVVCVFIQSQSGSVAGIDVTCSVVAGKVVPVQ